MNENSLKGMKIVWIEDDKFLGKMITKRFAPTGADLVQVTDGAVAFDAVRDNKPDIIMLDLLLPNVDGFEVLRRIKADEATRDIPVIVLSNLGQKDEVARIRELGVDKFFVKASIGLDGIIPEILRIVGHKIL
ncbi:MAG: response regulator [Candidatus Paceibacterota bacterium]|jgi:DNA-binding response OmpR family regulator